MLSRLQYLCDASFLVALQGDVGIIQECVNALNDPVWPVFLGRKCCVPAEPVFAETGLFESLHHVLASVPWRPRISAIDGSDRVSSRTLETIIEYPKGNSLPEEARLVHDVPKGFGYYNHEARWVISGQVTVSVEKATQSLSDRFQTWHDPYGPE